MTRRLLTLSAVVLLFTLSCAAQTSTSQISGTVRDSSGAVIPGATVTLTNEAMGVVQKQSTTEAGVYAFPAIPRAIADRSGSDDFHKFLDQVAEDTAAGDNSVITNALR